MKSHVLRPKYVSASQVKVHFVSWKLCIITNYNNLKQWDIDGRHIFLCYAIAK